MADKKIVFGVIGAGRIGNLHTENLVKNVPGARVKTIADVKIDDKLKEWANDLGFKLVSDANEILKDPEIQAVAICSSTDTHAKYIIEAAKAGKQIFCEKPIDYDLKRINEALAAVKQAEVKFMVGFNRRFDHNFQRVQKSIGAGDLGTPHIIKITSRDPAPPPIEYVKVSGGLFFDMCIHDFDMSNFLAGDMPVEVTANGSVLVNPEIGKVGDIDTAVVVLKYKNGAMCTIDNSRQAVYGYDQRIEVFGSKGCAIAGNDFPNTVRFFSDKDVWNDKMHYFFLERYMGAYIEELKTFMDCLRQNKEPPVGGKDGLNAVILAMAAKKSLDENRPVKISEIKA
ncbi:MAG: inositol 2-dehydrogenase [Candidatus Lokiarchaeota archaeon]|nr:inositol 2-dehydrogenase [Candidatus Lokiarchaeota archaeon]